jgi:hypothetical protein
MFLTYTDILPMKGNSEAYIRHPTHSVVVASYVTCKNECNTKQTFT